MNLDIFAGKRKQRRGRVKQAWGDLTDEELDMIEGSYDRFVGLLQEEYGYTRAEAESKIADLDS